MPYSLMDKRKMYLVFTFCLSFWGLLAQNKEMEAVYMGNSSKAKTSALLVGISDFKKSYGDSGPDDLLFAAKDAKDFSAYLTEQYEDKAEIKLLVDEKATLPEICKAIGMFMHERQGNIGKIYFLFSTHGGAPSKEYQNGYLYVSKEPDENSEALGDSYFDLRAFKSSLDYLIERKIAVVLLIDACHSGGFNSNRVHQAVKEWQKDSISVNFLACLASETAIESKDLANGLLVHYFIKGAKTGADENADYQINVREIRKFLEKNIPEEAYKKNHKQTPLIIALNDNLIISEKKQIKSLITPETPLLQMGKPSQSAPAMMAEPKNVVDSSTIIREKIKKALDEKKYDEAYGFLMQYKNSDSLSTAYQEIKYEYIEGVYRGVLKFMSSLVDFTFNNFFDFRIQPPGLNATFKSLSSCLRLLNPKEPYFKEIIYRSYILEGVQYQESEPLQKAIEVNPDFALPYLIMAKLNHLTNNSVQCLLNLNEYKKRVNNEKRIDGLINKVESETRSNKVVADNGHRQSDAKLGNTRNNYVAFLAGANDYKEFAALKYPVENIRTLKETLKEYSFSDENIISVENPTRQDFFQKTNELRSRAGKSDNLLVYISLHGVLNDNGRYFWLPVDAKAYDTQNWIFVRDFLDELDVMAFKHVLLIIDGCFGGSMFTSINYKSGGGNSADNVITQGMIKEYMEKKSALGITSGTSKNTVPDDSHFFRAFNKALKENLYEHLPVNRLFENTRDEIYNIQNRSNFFGIKIEPQLSKVNYLNDEGGQFVFYKKGGIGRLKNTNDVNPTKENEDKELNNQNNTHQFKLARAIHKETISLSEGERVEVIATGTITVGQFLGNVTPRGREKGLLGLSIDEFDIVPKYPHGALIYRILPSQSWVLCGDGCEIQATKSVDVTIEFTINDNNTADNSGSFNVVIRKL